MTYENAVPSSCIIPTFVVTFLSEVTNMKFVGVREFKEDVVKYLNEGS